MSGITVFNTKEGETKKQPMFFGQPLGVQRYDGSNYPVFEKLTQQQLGYFWRPEEVSLQKDRSDYQNTNDLKSDEIDVKESLDKLLGDCTVEQEEDCESCKI